ncbi:MAG: DUF1460 domain-containing protein [Muribaculaceae bacterium]|nr:DUF1460 domain-containing protein [Muribaculaceae bacterium]
MKLKRRYIVMLVALISVVYGVESHARYHCSADTSKVMNLVREFYSPGGDPGEIAGNVAEALKDVPYEEVIKNDSIGYNLVKADGFDDITFIDIVSAVSRLATSPGHKRINEFEKELENISYRRGGDKGFPSKMIYISDWIVDNKARNNVKELTENYSDQFRTKSLEKISRNRESYAALKDSAVYEAQKMVEMGFRTHKVPHLKREQAGSKEIIDEMRDGDIVVMLTSDPTTDALETGFVRKRGNGFHFIHPSAAAGKVVEEDDTLDRYIKRNAKRIYGWRWIRLSK